jgi:2-polyprenyl-3-methyl-5-hydroxy-6-metoxy-1,4-benzoquinol methylase
LIDQRYYYGDDYVHYEAQSGESPIVLSLMRDCDAGGPVLEIGCATGGVITALRGAGLEALGVDASSWAVGKAVRRLGVDAVALCDVESDPLPPSIVKHEPFGRLLLWAVLEHFRDPFAVVRSLTTFARARSVMLIRTTNADSLSHRILGSNWEGYFDWSHHSVDRITRTTIARELDRAGWSIARIATDHIWSCDADPGSASLRDWWVADARFRRLLVEHHLGDFLTCIAIRR